MIDTTDRATGKSTVDIRTISVVVVVSTSTANSAEETREELDEQETQGGQADAYDADVDLNGGPDADFDVVPGWVDVVAVEEDEGAQTKTTHDCDTGRKLLA